MNGRTSQQLFALLHDQFNLSELRQLAFELKINHENLPGDTRRDFARSLVEHAERHGLTNALNQLVDRELAARKEKAAQTSAHIQTNEAQQENGLLVYWPVFLVVGVLVIVVTLLLWPKNEPVSEATPSGETILLQVQVVSSEDQKPLSNVAVSLDYADSLFPVERTDSTGKAVFLLPAEAEGQIVRITVEADPPETQNVTVNAQMQVVMFQIRP